MARIFFAGGGTGGHLYPGHRDRARARARAPVDRAVLRRRQARHRARRAAEDRNSRTRCSTSIRSTAARSGTTQRRWSAALARGGELGRLARAEQPALVVGTGGYAAAFALAYAVVHRIPIVQQAGDSHPGLTARAFSRWSREIYLSFPEAARALNAHHPGSLVDTGAPIEPPPSPRPDQRAAATGVGFPERADGCCSSTAAARDRWPSIAPWREWIDRGLPDRFRSSGATGRGSFAQFKRLESRHAFECATTSPRSPTRTPRPISRSRAPAR